MSDPRILEGLREVATGDATRTDELVARARDGVPPEGDEEAFVRAALDRADDAALFARLGVSDEPTRATPPISPPPPAAMVSHAEPAAATRRPNGRVLAFVGGSVVSAVALAAAAVLLFRTPSATLPRYEGDVTGTDALVRSSAGAGTEVSAGARIVFVARPASPVEAPVYARAFGGCGTEAPLPIRVSVAPTGAARIEGSPETLFGAGAHGSCTLGIAVGTGPIPTPPDGSPGVQVVRARFDVK